MSDYLNNTFSVGGFKDIPDTRPLSQILAENELKIKIPYYPREVFRPIHHTKKRFTLTVAHRRAGKTVARVNGDIKLLLSNKRTFPVPQAAFISPTFAQGKRNAWQYAKYYTSPIPGVKYSESELTITLPTGARYLFAGSDNYEALRGLYLDHASLDEFGHQEPTVWGSIIRPALSDYHGTAAFIGSANGRNHFYDLLKRHENDPDWLITILKASETGILSNEELLAAKATMTEAQYQREYECNFDAEVEGSYYGKDMELAESEGRILSLPYDRAANVYAGWDMGIGDHMAIWVFQIVGKEYHFIDYYQNYSENLNHYIDWVRSRKYHIDTHFLPHDAEAREQITGKSRTQYLENHDFECEVVPKGSVDDGIAACRMVLNRCWFDKEKTASGIDCLRMYKSKFNEKDKVLSRKPKHDWASHGADAFRTAIMGVEERKKASKKEVSHNYREESWMA